MVVEHLPLAAEVPTVVEVPTEAARTEAEVPTVVAEARPTPAAEAADMPPPVEATAAIANLTDNHKNAVPPRTAFLLHPDFLDP